MANYKNTENKEIEFHKDAQIKKKKLKMNFEKWVNEWRFKPIRSD